jgi:hypothetical protein
MREVSDAFLLQVAVLSATLLGLFLIGVLFYVETGFRRLGAAAEVFQPYFRAGARIVLLLYALPLMLSLTLVVLGPNWNRVLFLLLSLTLLAANVDTAVRVRAVTSATRSPILFVNEVLGTIAVLTLVVVPWALGGLHPSREDLTWAILLSLGSGFLSVSALVLSVIDTARDEAPVQEPAAPPRAQASGPQ